MSLKLRSLQQRRQAEHLLCECGGLRGRSHEPEEPPPSKIKTSIFMDLYSVGASTKGITTWLAGKGNQTGAYDFRPPSTFLGQFNGLLVSPSLTPVIHDQPLSPKHDPSLPTE